MKNLSPQKNFEAPPGAEAIAKKLVSLLADSYLLALKTQNFHWNVEGKEFYGLHKLFEEQYTSLSGVIDILAERVRALGFYAPGSYKELLEAATIQEVPGGSRAAAEMLQLLLTDHRKLATQQREGSRISNENGDAVSAALFDSRSDFHEKTAWMLQSTLRG